MKTDVKPSQKEHKPFQSPEVRVVEASAGSGKTYALAKRYVQLLLNPDLNPEQVPIRNILAITFTNKAAYEMKSRILEVLKQIAVGNITAREQENILDPIGIMPAAASQKAYRVMESIIRNYNFFQVQTIDKFINALLSGCAFKIDLTSNFRIKTNSFEYLERSLDELIDSAPGNRTLTGMFTAFIHHYLYLENRTGWFPKKDMLDIILHLFGKYNTYGRPFKESSVSGKDLIKQKRSILESMNKLKAALPEGADKRFLTSLDKFLARHEKGFDVDSVPDYFAREELPVRKDTEIPRIAEKLWNKIREDLTSLCQSEAYALFDPYVTVFNEVLERFYELTSKDDVLFLEELNKRAGLLFDESYVTVEELYYRLATRFHHYLVDEFQDTSRLQWHNLEKMVEEALSTGGTLFYVGDRKQAIYAFRGGDVALFEDIRQRFQPFNVHTEVLANNWRSQKAIVEFNNTVFSTANLRQFIAKKQEHEEEKKSRRGVGLGEDDWQMIDAVYENARQVFRPGNDRGHVLLEFIDIDKKEERNSIIREKLLERIKELRTRFAYRDIAILTRDNSDVELTTNWLLEEGILVDSERTSNIKENHLIQELVLFLKFLDSPIDNISFAHFILGDLFLRTTGLSREEMQRFVFSLRTKLKGQKDFYLYTAFREQYFDVWEKFIEEFFKNVGLYPLYELAVSVYYRFGFLEHFPEAQGFLMHFLELIKKNEEDHADIESFLNYFENLEGEGLYVQITDTDAVKILTIHKAKGLEFPVVILPFLGMDVQVAVSKDNIQSYILQDKDGEIELIRFKNQYRKFSEELSAIYDQEYKKMLLIELNNVYVALTRARHEMYGFIPKKVGNSTNIVRFLIPEELYTCATPGTYAPAPSRDTSLLRLPRSEYHDWIEYLKDEFLDLAEIKHRQERLQGELMHYLLSFVKDLSEQNKDSMLKEAIQNAQNKFSSIKDMSPFALRIEKILGAASLKEIFYLDKTDKVLTEQEIVNRQGDTKRLDRVIIREKEVWVIDYKSTHELRGQYKEQVQEYMKLLEDIYPAKAVRGFLVYLDESNLEEID